jgi:iron complex outermembrane recepter protein
MRRTVFLCVIVLLGRTHVAAQDLDAQLAQNLKRLSIEELTQLDITIASRRVEPLAQVAAAVSVIRGEDIRRAGVTNLAEALRLADGIAVARADNTTWAISTRGFNITTANKLLVLIDGRTVYSPLSAGTFWSVQDIPLVDIDRIEVIRGPGGAVWGANAVNGVVNIVTKPAAETKGIQLVVGGGTEERAIVTAQYGDRLGRNDYRVYGKFRARDGQIITPAIDANDDVRIGQAGFRLESPRDGRNWWLVQGDAYAGREGLFNAPDTHVSGGNVMGRWGRRFSHEGQFRAQVYFDHVYRRVFQQLRDFRNTIDVDAQHQARFGRHGLIVGGNVRASRGDDRGNAAFHFDPQARTSTIVGVFAQDEIRATSNLAVIVGSKFERNTFTGMEAQPSARVRWTPSRTQTLWGAVSRAVRLPTRFDTDLRFTNPVTGATTLSGSMDFDTEKVIAYETGYRAEVSKILSLDFAAFTNVYDDMRSQELPPPGVGGPVTLGNLMNARTAGFESAGTVLVGPLWRLQASYAYLHESVSFDPGSRDPTGGVNEYNDPSHMFKLRSNLDLPYGIEVDGFLRHVGRLPHPVVEAYTELDARVGWRATPSLEFAVIGQNLLHASHREFQLASPRREEFQRGVYARMLWRY